jgi:hypothetical protein
MTDQEGFWSIAAQLGADRRWARRILWIRVTSRLMSLGMRAISCMAPAAIVWIL